MAETMHRNRNKNILYITMSVIISLFFHLAVFILTSKITVGPSYFGEMKKIPSHFIKLGKVDVAMPTPVPEQKKEKKSELLPAHLDEKMKEMTANETPSKVPLPGNGAEPGKGEDLKVPGIKVPTVPGLHKTLVPPDILQVDGDSLAKNRLDFNRILIPKIPRSGRLGGMYGEGDGEASGLAGGLGKIPLQMRLSMPEHIKSGIPEIPGTKLLPTEKTSVLDNLLDIKIYKFRIPEGGGFFRVDILPKKDAKLRPFKKDIVFCLDVSGSISTEKLAEFKNGISNALNKLSPDDRFEIMAFRHRQIPLFGGFRSPTTKNIREADEFLFKLVRTGSTNIFSAIEPFAGKDNQYKSPDRPLLMFLSSDGMVNSGEVADSRDVINIFSNRNQETASLFTFCTGKKSNSFLLDLLSYRNRGESFKADNVKESGQVLGNFIENVSEVYVMDLDYQISGNLTDLTFPKKLPHLYTGHPLSVYGYYAADTDEVGLRITGKDSLGRKQELIYKGSISKAEDADENLAKYWALQYIYHLYSRLTASYSEDLRMQIHKIAAQYAIEAPYFDQYLLRKKNYVGK